MSDGGLPYKLPIILLALCCLFPLFSLNPFSYGHAWLFNGLTVAGNHEGESTYHTIIPVLVNIISVVVLYTAYVIYGKPNSFKLQQSGFFYRLSYNQWYLDIIYQRFIVKPVIRLCSATFWIDRNVIDGFLHLLARISGYLAKLTAWTDEHIVDGFLHLLTSIVQSIGNFARRFQSGKIQYYLFSMLVIVLLLFILKILI
jgi:NADH-quinone oxidoreductase subunit L